MTDRMADWLQNKMVQLGIILIICLVFNGLILLVVHIVHESRPEPPPAVEQPDLVTPAPELQQAR